MLSGAWGGIENTAKTVFNRIRSFFGGFWGDLKSGFQTRRVRDRDRLGQAREHLQGPGQLPHRQGVRRAASAGFWNDVVNAVGLSKLDLPNVATLAAGGKVTQGSGPTSDDVLARVSKGETVVSAAHSKVLAPAFAALGVPGYAPGGIPNPVKGITHAIGGAIDVAKIVAALATGNTKAFSNALNALVHTTGAGKLRLAADRCPADADPRRHQGRRGSAGATRQAAVPPAVPRRCPAGRNPAKNAALARKMMPSWAHGAEWTAWNNLEMAEAGWNQYARNPSSGAYGIPQALPPVQDAGPRRTRRSPARGADLLDGGYIKQPVYGTPSALRLGARAVAHHWYDKGGWLKPGRSAATGCGKPEAVLTPEESAAFVQLVKGLTAGQGRQRGMRPGGGAPVVLNFNGTQHPDAGAAAGHDAQTGRCDRRGVTGVSGD